MSPRRYGAVQLYCIVKRIHSQESDQRPTKDEVARLHLRPGLVASWCGAGRRQNYQRLVKTEMYFQTSNGCSETQPIFQTCVTSELHFIFRASHSQCLELQFSDLQWFGRTPGISAQEFILQCFPSTTIANS